MKCEHGNWAEDCRILCKHCGHECSHHTISSNIACFADGCTCKGYETDLDSEYEIMVEKNWDY